MSAEQGHGKRFESALVYQSGCFPLMEGVEVPYTSLYDVPPEYTDDNIPVSIKTSKYPESETATPTLYLSDAVRFFEATTVSELRLLAGFYHSQGSRAIFYQILEVVLIPALAGELWGGIEQEEIAAFAEYIKSEKARIGDEPKAIEQLQRDVRAYKSQFEGLEGLIVLNPKVARNVGRLQCSMDAGLLLNWASEKGLMTRVYDTRFGAIPLPIAFESGARVGRALKK